MPASKLKLPTQVVALGWVSLLMDASSELIHSLLPLYMVTVLGASALAVGIIEGIAEATAALVKIFSGAFSDWIGKRKPLLLAGYGLGALSKPLFALATTTNGIFAARFIDRIGKGIRGAPRDALIADVTPPAQRGAAFGLRQSMDTVGAVIGPMLAVGLMALTHDDFHATFWVAVIPAALCVLVIGVAVKDAPNTQPNTQPRPARLPIHRADLARLPRAFWWVTGFAALLTLARFSEAFLLLRGENLGIALAWTPALLALMNIVYAASAWPFGRLFDNGHRRILLVAGIALLIAADLLLAFGSGPWAVAFGAILWGLHMGATQGILSALVAHTAPADLRGTAFGCFNFASGIALLIASVMAGALWTYVGPAATFIAGALCALLALPGLLRKA
jgi:MFS family permease